MGSIVKSVPKVRDNVGCRGVRATQLLASSRCAIGAALNCVSLGRALRSSRMLTMTFSCAVGKGACRINRFSSSVGRASSYLFIGLLGGASGSPSTTY